MKCHGCKSLNTREMLNQSESRQQVAIVSLANLLSMPKVFQRKGRRLDSVSALLFFIVHINPALSCTCTCTCNWACGSHYETSSVRNQNVLDTIGHDRQLVSQQRLSAQVLVEGHLLVGQAFEGPLQGHHVQEHLVWEQLFLRHFFRAC